MHTVSHITQPNCVFSPAAQRFLQHPLCAFTPPHHQGGHQQGDEHRDCDERSQDADRWVVDEPAGQRAGLEVVLMNLHEESVDNLVWPEAAHPQGHLVGAVRHVPVSPAGGDKTQSESCTGSNSKVGERTEKTQKRPEVITTN